MRHESGDFCRDWAANFPIFGHKKFTALCISNVICVASFTNVGTQIVNAIPRHGLRVFCKKSVKFMVSACALLPVCWNYLTVEACSVCCLILIDACLSHAGSGL